MKISETTGRYIFSGLLVVSLILITYNFTQSSSIQEKDIEFDLIKRYLVTNSSVARSDKPIIWVHNDYETNDRNWLSFGSRNSKELNKPVVYLTTHSIIKNCDKSFNICIIDDNSFANLIPGWSTDLDSVPEPSKKHYRFVGFLHLLFLYGGMVLPSSFLCFQDLISVYEDHIKKGLFVTETVPASVLSESTQSFPTANIIGAEKKNEEVHKLIRIMEDKFISSLTDEASFTGFIEKQMYAAIQTNKCELVAGSVFGYFDKKGEYISISKLMGDDVIDLDDRNVGIHIPIDDIIQRKHYDWFSKIDLDDLPKVNNNIGYLLSKIYC